VNLADLAGKSSVIKFGPGSFRLQRNGDAWHTPRAGIRSLEIRGAGMDATTLQAGDVRDLLLVPEGTSLENLVIADLTFDAGGGSLLDVRGRVSVALENVRFENSQHGAGHSAPVGISGDAFFGAKGCEFLGPGRGFALSVRGSGLALFESCRFDGLESAVIGQGERADSVVHYLECDFTGTRVTDSRVATRPAKVPRFPIRVRGGRVRWGPPETTEERRKEEWGLPFVAEATGIEFGPSIPSCTLGLLLAALDRVSVGEDESVLGIRVLTSGRSGPESLGVTVRNLKTNAVRHFQCRADGSQPTEWPRRMGTPGVPSPEQVVGALPLGAVLRLSGLPEGTAANSLAYGSGINVNREWAPSVRVEAPPDWPTRELDARDGKDHFAPR
jgi:hypothetical protein